MSSPTLTWTEEYDGEGWPICTSNYVGAYRGYFSRHHAKIEVGDYPAAWNVTLTLDDSELDEPAYYQEYNQTWEDWASGAMAWCEERIARRLEAGWSAKDITSLWRDWPNNDRSKPLPWACEQHQNGDRDDHDVLECADCRARLDAMKAADWSG